MLILSGAEVEALLDPADLVEALTAAMAELSSGAVSMPARIAATVPDRDGLLAAMPAYLPSTRTLAVKLVSVFPANREIPSHQAVVCCFDGDTGQPVAIIEGTYLTAARTAAGSALATRLLARPGSRRAAIIGTGVQARAHAHALDRAGGLSQLVLAGRNPIRARTLAAELDMTLRATVGALDSVAEAVRNADVVCLTTHAADPVLRREWLPPGCHVNSVGYNTTGRGELDADTIRAAAVLAVESREVTLAAPPAGAVELCGIDRAVVEIGELVSGAAPGRCGRDDLTVYKSVGVAVQDAAAAALVLAAAHRHGAGHNVQL
ncbi:MAG TPA: ornithine cyclodeaminase family protein [Mycobacteriales bacterium]|nr:ornithine cyclodeaminase family protein [Mycobacteriales bacterium]